MSFVRRIANLPPASLTRSILVDANNTTTRVARMTAPLACIPAWSAQNNPNAPPARTPLTQPIIAKQQIAPPLNTSMSANASSARGDVQNASISRFAPPASMRSCCFLLATLAERASSTTMPPINARPAMLAAEPASSRRLLAPVARTLFSRFPIAKP